MNNVTLLHGDCLDHLRALPANSVDSVVTDPPYELGFMGRAWDASGIAYSVDLWREVARVLKPGGHVVAFGGTRTYHRMACAMEDAGLEIRDSLHWLYGSGFPKSHDVSKALDKAAGAERPVVGIDTRNLTSGTGIGSLQKAWKDNGGRQYTAGLSHDNHVAESGGIPITAPATDLAAQWAGWGTALKPAHEPIVLARKPLAGNVAATVAQWGTGGINIDACRVPGAIEGDPARFAKTDGGEFVRFNTPPVVRSEGRWPPNVLLTHSAACNGHCAPDCPVAALDRQSGERKAPATYVRTAAAGNNQIYGKGMGKSSAGDVATNYGDTGGASRFFPVLAWDPAWDVPFAYVPKASRRERNAGCAGLPEHEGGTMDGGHVVSDGRTAAKTGRRPVTNHHPCVKPVALLSWLATLVTPPGGVVLDPFMGSGSTGVACVRLGFDFIGCEQDPDYLAIARARIAAVDPLFQEVAS